MMIEEMIALLRQGEEVSRMMQVTGEEGVSNEDYILYQKATLLDMVYLQQDAFDPVDVSTSIERQQESLKLLNEIMRSEISFGNKKEIRDWFNRLTAEYKNMNYSAFHSDAYREHKSRITNLIS